jgi:GNAT superfamily N-acetyltransferase
MRIVNGSADRADETLAAIRESFAGHDFVHRPFCQAQLGLLEKNGLGEHQLVLDGKRIAAVFFVQRNDRSVVALFLDHHDDVMHGVLGAYFGRSRRWVEKVVRPSWDLRVGAHLLPLFEEAGFRPGPPERLFRLRRSEYRAGYDVREMVEGSRADYRMHDRNIAGTLDTLTPLLQAWSGFYGLEGHSEKTCRLFTASVDAQKTAVLWVLLPSRCRQDQNDCYLHWKKEIGESAIFVRSIFTEDPFRGMGIGSSLHRFMLSRFFKGPGTVESSWVSTNEENRAGVGLLESLGYRRQRVCRYHYFIR